MSGAIWLPEKQPQTPEQAELFLRKAIDQLMTNDVIPGQVGRRLKQALTLAVQPRLDLK